MLGLWFRVRLGFGSGTGADVDLRDGDFRGTGVRGGGK